MIGKPGSTLDVGAVFQMLDDMMVTVQTTGAICEVDSNMPLLRAPSAIDVIESVVNAVHRTGGLVKSINTDATEGGRYEGALIRTNTMLWYRKLLVLPFSGQWYNVVLKSGTYLYPLMISLFD
ncbi:hypothetical protein H257_03579 [Aphanomyces astaci]|uniref:Uncharacterized protein n=1 Tax=Aphanomyces astaci TaxID=112090 RepID=W4GZI9_APHAT|nr:hypothetical protein H257_03579 [Aphanomyces astaci]ETV84343.1 hypothetical protein H257_03579 [Aphanomyces astaci]|eukprot:XP_009826035.1 hypothetical protein H257_03579 [Aphanomyces astaci]